MTNFLKKYLLFTFALLCLTSISFAQGDLSAPTFNFESKPLFGLQDQIVRDSLSLWEERVYLHTDRQQAEAGDYIFFKAYVFNGPTQKRFSPSGVLRLELRNSENELVSKQYHPVEQGTGEGVVKLPKKMKEGNYELLAYTRWMQNYGEDQYFRKSLRIGDVENTVRPEPSPSTATRLEFYPEGGQLLAGIPNRLVLATHNSGENNGSAEGQIIDQQGNRVATVQPYSKGYGMAILQPEAGKTYLFKPEQGDARPLPEIQKEGYSIRVNTLSSERLRVEVLATESLKGNPVILEGKKDDKSYFIHVLEFEDDAATLDISKTSLPQGLMTLYLSGMDQVLWAERTVWIDTKEELSIQVSQITSKSSKDDEMAFRIKVRDADGAPVQTDLSAAVKKGEGQSQDGIDRYLNPLSSDAQLSDKRSIRFVEDLKAQSLEMDADRNETPDEIRFPVERSLELHGTAYDLNNVLLANTEIQMMASSDSTLVVRELKTDAAGVLHVTDLTVVGETQFIFRTKGEDQTDRLVKIRPIESTQPIMAEAKEGATETGVAESKIYQKKQRKKEFIEATLPVEYDTTGLIELEEATVIDKRKREQELVPSLVGLDPNSRDVAYQDPDKPLSWIPLLQKIPGLQVRYNSELIPVVTHLRRGGGRPFWVVDGWALAYNNDPAFSPLTLIPFTDILRIEFVMPPFDTSAFSSVLFGGNGALVVYTRSGNGLDYVNRKEGGLNFKGYQPALDFETYLAEREKDRKLRKNPSATLYWNPSIQTDKKGEAIIRFSSPEELEKIQISIETLTPDGSVGSFRGSFKGK